MNPKELVIEFPNLSLVQIYDALSFYHDYRKEIKKDLALNLEANFFV